MTDRILSYFEMNKLGALLISGYWGTGKTYYLNNELIPKLKERRKVPIVISLFGIESIEEIYKTIFYVSCDAKKNDWVQAIKKWGTKLFDYSSFLKGYIDLSRLINLQNHLDKILDKESNIIIFDDFERLKSIDKSDFLGFVNQLVEHLEIPVIIIANEDEIGDELKYKEKVIGKTFEYKPQLSLILESIVNKYNDPLFTTFTKNKALFSTTFNVDQLRSNNRHEDSETSNTKNTLSKFIESHENIRTIKFAIEHYYVIFNHLVSTESDLTEPLTRKLINIWSFVWGISVAFKNNYISYRNNLNLDTLTQTLDLENTNQVIAAILSRSQEENKSKTSDTVSFAKDFQQLFFQRVNESYTFYPEIYAYITGGFDIDYVAFKKQIVEEFTHQSGIPAVELMSEFMQPSIWDLPDNEFEEKLRALHQYVKNGEIPGIINYLHASVALLNYSDIVGIKRETMVEDIKAGIDKAMKKYDTATLEGINIQVLKHQQNYSASKEIFDHIEQINKAKESEEFKSEINELEQLFISDTRKFVLKFLPQNMQTTPKLFSIPVMQCFKDETIEKRAMTLQSADVSNLVDLFTERYTKHSEIIKALQPEATFLKKFRENITNHRQTGKATLSEKNITAYLIPIIDKSLRCLNPDV